MGNLYSSLAGDLSPVRPLFFQPLPDITNYRIEGDRVSLADNANHIGDVITIDSPIPDNLLISATLLFIFPNHGISTVVKQLEGGVYQEPGLGRHPPFSNLVVTQKEIIVAEDLPSGPYDAIDNYVYQTTADTSEDNYVYQTTADTSDWVFLDPPSYDGYEIYIGEGNPLITETFLPFYGDG